MSDPINPSHYKKGSVECIDAIQAALTADEFRGFLKGNAIKYLYRERDKGGDTDLEKAKWFLGRLTGSGAAKTTCSGWHVIVPETPVNAANIIACRDMEIERLKQIISELDSDMKKLSESAAVATEAHKKVVSGVERKDAELAIRMEQLAAVTHLSQQIGDAEPIDRETGHGD